MQIDLFLVPFVIVLGLLFAQNDNKRSRLQYILLSSAVLLFVAAMRDPDWMTFAYSIDTESYKELFERTLDMSWGDIWTTSYLRYFGRGGEKADVGYIILNKIIGYFTHDFNFFSLIADLIFFIPLGIILYRYSANIYHLIFAFVFYIALIQVYLFGGGRQMFAIGMDVLALLSVIDGKRVRAILLFIIGITFHFSSFLFLMPLLMVWFDINPKTLKTLHIVSFLVFPIALLMPSQIITFMGESSGIEQYANYGKEGITGGALSFIVFMELLSLFCLIAIKQRHLLQYKSIRIFYVMTPFFTFFVPLIRANGTMIRIALYYTLFLMLLVPDGIDCLFRIKDRNLVYFFVIGAFALWIMISGGMTYYFYWQV